MAVGGAIAAAAWASLTAFSLSASASADLISLSNSSLARLNSPVLLPIPLASSGNFLAPKSRRTIMKIAAISPPPRPKIASVCVMSVIALM